jgi:protease II
MKAVFRSLFVTPVFTVTAVATTALLLTACDSPKPEGSAMATDTRSLAPPVARIDKVSDTHWGVSVDDPYRYMEDVEDPYVVEWFKAQAAYAQDQLGALPAREALFERMVELDQGAPFSTSSVKQLSNGDVFYLRREAGENLSKLYVQISGAESPRLLVDPESMGDEDDQHFSIRSTNHPGMASTLCTVWRRAARRRRATTLSM